MLVVRLLARRLGRSLGIDERTLLRLAKETPRGLPARSGVRRDPAAGAAMPSGVAVAAVYTAWSCGLVAFLLVVFNVHLFVPDGRPVGIFQLSVGTILLVVGLALAFEWLPFRLLPRARQAAEAARTGARPRGVARWPRLAGAGFTLVGVVWVGAGVLNVVRGAVELAP
jgi:hypothetical protein